MKRTYKLIFAAIAASLVFASCTNENYDGTQPEGTRVITASFDPQTRTYLDGLTPKFNDGDEILVSNGTTIKILPIYVNDGRSLFSTILTGELTAVYPAEAAVVENNVIKGVKVPAEQSGRFADANIAIAERVVKSAHFSNQTALFIITPQEGAGRLTITSAVAPINTKGANDEEKRKVTVKGTDSDGKFYVALLSGAKLSDLTFDTGGEKVKYSVAEIEAMQTEDIVVTGRAYQIGRSKWVSCVNTIKGAIEALRGGKTAVEITSPTDIGTPVDLPSSTDGKDISISIKGVTGSTITFQLEDDAKGPENLYIDTDAKELVINCPNSHVEVNGGNYQTVTATTSASTLVVGKGVTIGTLDIKGGNAEICGLVSKVTRQGSEKIQFSISTPETLVRLSELVNGGNVPSCTAVLTEDIDLSGRKWKSINTNSRLTSFDGQGHTIDNMDVDTENAKDWAGFISKAYNDFTIKNVTFTNAKLEWPASAVTDARGGIVVGSIYKGEFINCHVKNSHISAFQKIGGIVGCIFETTADVTVKDCTVEGLSMEYSIEDPDGSYTWQAGGIAGYVTTCGNRTFENCSVKNITVKSPCTDYNLAYFSHAFVGNLITYGNNCGSKTITFKGNKVDAQLSGVTPGMYSSDFFGWADNKERVSVPLPKIIIDGKTWEPKNP